MRSIDRTPTFLAILVEMMSIICIFLACSVLIIMDTKQLGRVDLFNKISINRPILIREEKGTVFPEGLNYCCRG